MAQADNWPDKVPELAGRLVPDDRLAQAPDDRQAQVRLDKRLAVDIRNSEQDDRSGLAPGDMSVRADDYTSVCLSSYISAVPSECTRSKKTCRSMQAAAQLRPDAARTVGSARSLRMKMMMQSCKSWNTTLLRSSDDKAGSNAV